MDVVDGAERAIHAVHLGNADHGQQHHQAENHGESEHDQAARAAPVSYTHLDVYKRQGLLQARREQHGEIEAGRHAGVQDAIGRADLLAVHAERGGRLGVVQRFGRQRAVNGRYLLPDHVAALLSLIHI